MASAARLYTPEVLSLAAGLAAVPLDPAMPLQGRARSPACGSAIDLSLRLDDAGAIAAVGLRARACAIGQASAAIFAAAAPGRSLAEIAGALAGLEVWLAEGGALPEWPGLDPLVPARDFPGRHGAILLPWKAAVAALSPA